ncbi:type II toxin-antitoxin system VapC family toxin [Candidatus Woesearchaeota archaeon]|nr:type II toxin-antitoxin system VapC family toxin [Candidatus Woesearchaeota archaeon]
MTVLIDSWTWIEYFKGSPYGKRGAPYVEGHEEIIVSTMNVAEVYHFLLKEARDDPDGHIDFMLKRSFVIPLTPEIALLSARNKFTHKMGMADAIVLATATTHGATVVTGDDDFKNHRGVTYIGP